MVGVGNGKERSVLCSYYCCGHFVADKAVVDSLGSSKVCVWFGRIRMKVSPRVYQFAVNHEFVKVRAFRFHTGIKVSSDYYPMTFILES